MSRLPHRISPQSVSVLIKGRFRTVNKDTVNFGDLVEALKADVHDVDLIASLVDVVSFIALKTVGRVQVSGDEVRFDGKTVEHPVLTKRILSHLHDGISIVPLANFLERLMANPSTDVRHDLFEWLDSGDTPITEEGKIVAFKKVQGDYYSFHTGSNGKVLHAMGSTVSIPREEVDGNRYNECSYGLHFCSYGYLQSYYGNRGRVLIVEIDPADVVAIPTDYSRQKGRTCSMVVVGEVPEDEASQIFTGVRVYSNGREFDEDTTTLDEADELAERENEDDVDFDFEEEDDADFYFEDEDADIIGHETDETTVELTFERNGVTYTGQQIVDTLATSSQRQAAQVLGVPKATLYDWNKKAIAAGITPTQL